VLAGPGLFGGLFELKGFKKPVLVSSVDGVGTKLKIANALDRYDTIGIDLVNHCVNDILTCGAEPLFFLDYIAMGRLLPDKVESIVQGLANACQEVACALIGGETAEMPGIYAGEDYDLVGFIIGAVEKDKIIDGRTIATGDIAIGLASSGLHTNGYSLARKVFGETTVALDRYYPELGKTIGEALLATHVCYYHQLKPVLPLIKGIAHITGGGLIGNVPRILPPGLAVEFDSKSWEVPPIFQLIQQQGDVDKNEMYRVFNMGIGMVFFCAPESVSSFTGQIPETKVIGRVVKQKDDTRVTLT
jgi:phosphoribosylformylglycinamidine cyclo-ligase